jgi:hypothetical protein
VITEDMSREQAWGRVADGILETPGALSQDVRRAIARGDDPPELATLLEKVRRNAYRIVDADVAGHEEDAVLEAALAAALAVALEQRSAALRAVEAAGCA